MDRARIAGVFYLLVFVTGGLALVVRGGVGSAAGLMAGLFYVAVTLLFYDIFKPVNRGVSLLAASVSLVGIVVGPVLKVNPLPFLGLYCLLIGYLIFRSTFLPRTPGILGEGSLTVWLLVFGLNPVRPFDSRVHA